ncbi:MAG: hypothetical protein GYB65_12710 [Chloroflexi bacterium]|nr:hypothetical protein [Chloroflexota bacterium]
MVHLEISPHIAQRLQALSEQARTSIDELLLRLLEDYGSTLISDDAEMSGGDLTWTEDELAEILRPTEPLTGQEIVEQGFIGGWEDLGIEDSVAWLAQQKASRKKKHQV